MWMGSKYQKWISCQKKNEKRPGLSNQKDSDDSSFLESDFTKEIEQEALAWTNFPEI
jgi:hypothetical protein